MRRTIFRYATAIGAGIALGIGSLAAALFSFPAWGVLHNGPWTIDPAMGSPSAGHTRGPGCRCSARSPSFPAGAAYYLGYDDSTGAPLNARCTYTVTGRDPDAGWWSITVYDANGFLLPDTGGRFR